MDFQDYVRKEQEVIQKEKNRVLSEWKKIIDTQTAQLKNLSTLLVKNNNGGKNIRGSLVCLGYSLYAEKESLDIYTIAAAYEILHTSLLIHDDIIDKSNLRRGKPTLFQQLGGNHYGISQAICLGDAGFFLAAKMISETSFPGEIKATIISQFSQIVLDTITGQMLDVKFANTLSKVSEKDVIQIALLKTARYTIAGPLLLGAILAGADKKQLETISLFGEKLGIAFQIKDDVLSIFGSERTTGKSATSDIEEGKNTLLITYARSHASREQKKVLDNYYGKGKITRKEHAMIQQVLQDTGAYNYAEKKIQTYTKDAVLLIPKLVIEQSLKNLLKDFITYLIQRDR